MEELTREKMEKKMDKLMDRLENLKPGALVSDERKDGTLDIRYEVDKEFMDTLEAIERLNKMLYEDDKLQGETLDKNRRFDLEEEKATTDRIVAKEKGKETKSKYWLSAMQIGGALLCITATAIAEATKILPNKQFDFVKWFRPRA